MSGDPPNIIIGTALGYTFTDFARNTGLIVAICFVVIVAYFLLIFRKELKATDSMDRSGLSCPEPATAIHNKKLFIYFHWRYCSSGDPCPDWSYCCHNRRHYGGGYDTWNDRAGR